MCVSDAAGRQRCTTFIQNFMFCRRQCEKRLSAATGSIGPFAHTRNCGCTILQTGSCYSTSATRRLRQNFQGTHPCVQARAPTSEPRPWVTKPSSTCQPFHLSLPTRSLSPRGIKGANSSTTTCTNLFRVAKKHAKRRQLFPLAPPRLSLGIQPHGTPQHGRVVHGGSRSCPRPGRTSECLCSPGRQAR